MPHPGLPAEGWPDPRSSVLFLIFGSPLIKRIAYTFQSIGSPYRFFVFWMTTGIPMTKYLFSLLSAFVLLTCTSPSSSEAVAAPIIYMDYTEAGLDSAYAQSFWAPNRVSVFKQLRELKNRSQISMGRPQKIQYDSAEAAQLDLYLPADPQKAPIHIHIHGGAWRGGNGSGEKAYYGRKFVESGALYIAPDYELVREDMTSLYPMVEQLRQAVVWTYQQAEKYGGNPDRIFLSGHSAGGHLGGVLLTTDWSTYGLPSDVIKGALLTSGMYDLYPVSLSSRNEYVDFTEQMINELSPIKHIDQISAPVIIAYGTEESPAFKKQSQAFAEALKQQSKTVELYELQGLNHFEIMVAIGNPYSLLGEEMLNQMQLD